MELEQKILDATLKTRPADATHWSVRVLAKHLGVSRMLVQRVWHRYDIQPHPLKTLLVEPEDLGSVVGKVYDPPVNVRAAVVNPYDD